MPRLNADRGKMERIGKMLKERAFSLGLSPEAVAKKAGCHRKTALKVYEGRARDRSMYEVAQALGVKIDKIDGGPPPNVEMADEDHGGYSRSSFMKEYEGLYAAYRCSYDAPRHAIRSVFALSWPFDANCAIFSENQKYVNAAGRLVDYSQDGEIYSNTNTSVMHLLTNDKGRLRLITLSKLHPPEDFMLGGVVTTSRRTSQPAMSPMVLEKLGAATTREEADRLVGEITPSDPEYARAEAVLMEAERSILLCTWAGRAAG